MNYGSNAGKTYREQQILNASPAERIVLLYNGAIKFLLLAKASIEKNNIQERFNNNKKALDIITYLQATLDMEKGGDIATNLYRIYNYMQMRLIDVDMKNDVTAIDDVVEKLRELNASWVKVAQTVEGAPSVSSENSTQSDEKESQRLSSFDSLA